MSYTGDPQCPRYPRPCGKHSWLATTGQRCIPSQRGTRHCNGPARRDSRELQRGRGCRQALQRGGLCCNVLRGVATGTLESGAKFDSATRFAFTVDAGEVAMHRDRLLVGLHRSVVAALHLWRW